MMVFRALILLRLMRCCHSWMMTIQRERERFTRNQGILRVLFYYIFTQESAMAVNISINNTLRSLTDIMQMLQMDVHYLAESLRK